MKSFDFSFGFIRRNLRLTALSALSAISLLAAIGLSANTHLIIHFNDGTTTSFVLADKPAVSFVDKNIRVRAKHVDTDYDASLVNKFVFGDASSIENVAENETRFTITDPDHVDAIGLRAGEAISVVSTDGRLLLNARADENGSVCLDISNLPKGVLIIASQSGNNLKIKR